MNDSRKQAVKLPPEQQAIRDKCFHPTGAFVEFPRAEIDQSIPQRFEKIVDKFADRVAVKTKKYTLTYNTLNQTANRIARTVYQRCAEKEHPVVLLLLEKDSPAIATILGVLKAGKMYLVLDPSSPRERLAFMLADSHANLIVTDDKNFPLAEALVDDQQKLLNIDSPDANFPNENLGLAILPDALAYIRYTSGSTGEPKGILEYSTSRRNRKQSRIVAFIRRETLSSFQSVTSRCQLHSDRVGNDV